MTIFPNWPRIIRKSRRLVKSISKQHNLLSTMTHMIEHLTIESSGLLKLVKNLLRKRKPRRIQSCLNYIQLSNKLPSRSTIIYSPFREQIDFLRPEQNKNN